MTLVDTSVWIRMFQKHKPLRLLDVVTFDDVVTSLPIVQEVLQGFRDETAFRQARMAMLSFPIVDSPIPQNIFEEAIHLYRNARKNGFTVRSSVDCLIAASAIKHNLIVLHQDRDFPQLASISSLRQKAVQHPE